MDLLRKCLLDSDDEVRERAHFYISVIENEEQSTDIDEMGDFIFDTDQEINIDILEANIKDNMDLYVESESPLNLDLSIMMQKKQ